jgi:antitoxin CptB
MNENTIAALRYRCRRGMLELDVKLRNFIDQNADQLSASDCQVFADILERPDPVIFAYIFSDLVPDNQQEIELIKRIKASK